MTGSSSKNPLTHQAKDKGGHPVASLHKRINSLFEDFWHDFLPAHNILQQGADFVPNIDISENDNAITVMADLPGLEEKDVSVTLSSGVLSISGEKKSEHEEKTEDHFHVMERSYGSFRRDITVGPDVDDSKIKADFANGVLTCTLPKKERAKAAVKKIKING